jgi:hypothetical protein
MQQVKMTMKNPLFGTKHLLEYLTYGSAAAFLYCIMFYFHISDRSYQSSYLLYIGNMLFCLPILLYNIKLFGKPYDKKRTVTMLIASHIASLAGTVLSVILSVLLMLMYYPDMLSSTPDGSGLANAPEMTQMQRPTGWLFMIVINALLLNFSAGSFISIVTSYAGKKDQTKDKPAHLGKHVSDGPVTNDA